MRARARSDAELWRHGPDCHDRGRTRRCVYAGWWPPGIPIGC